MGVLMTFVSTVLGGVLIFVIGQFLLKIIIEPMMELKKSIGALSYILLLHHSKISNAIPNEDVANEIKNRSVDILSKANVVTDSKIILRMFGLPSKPNISLAMKSLNRIYYYLLEGSRHFEKSTSFNGKKTDFAIETSYAINKISKLLKFKIDHE
jgi:hypothetical protein